MLDGSWVPDRGTRAYENSSDFRWKSLVSAGRKEVGDGDRQLDPPSPGGVPHSKALPWMASLRSSWVGGLRPSSQGRELPLPARVRGTAEALPLLVMLHLNWKVGQGLPARGLDRHGVQGRRPPGGRRRRGL